MRTLTLIPFPLVLSPVVITTSAGECAVAARLKFIGGGLYLKVLSRTAPSPILTFGRIFDEAHVFRLSGRGKFDIGKIPNRINKIVAFFDCQRREGRAWRAIINRLAASFAASRSG